MRNRVHAYLRALGCRSVPAGGLRSCGQAFHIRKRFEAEQESNRLYRERRAALADQRRAQRLADRERLKQLGGVPRSEEEQREFIELLARTGASEAYFESRGWERRAA